MGLNTFNLNYKRSLLIPQIQANDIVGQNIIFPLVTDKGSLIKHVF